MNLHRLRVSVAAGAAFGVAGTLAGIGLGLLLYALLKQWLDPAIAAGLSFLLFAAVALLAGLIIKSGVDAPRKAHAGEAVAGPAPGLPERILDLARRKPVIALAGAGLAAAVALRNPVLIATVVGAILNRGHHRR